ncbi:MAG TPA: helix-turn-helix transcriptional regulator [Syntrophales bacterium]|nr:helix-turn-helix transcriptional regulator [Syntrophales bacterium]
MIGIKSRGKHPPGRGAVRDKIPIPVSPVIYSALRAMYGGKRRDGWESDSWGRPFFRYRTRAGSVTFFYSPPPNFSGRFHPSISMYYTPRLSFVYSGSLRSLAGRLSVETADVFLILLSRIAGLRDPKETAQIRLDEIADMRGVHLRRGSGRKLREDLKQEILRISDLRLSMSWKDYPTGGRVSFGNERPDKLLDILDFEYASGKGKRTAFRYRCGQALSHFLNPEGLFWIGYYSRSLLNLSPYHEAFTKKIGTYWIMVGTVAGKKGLPPRAAPRSILDFCGEGEGRDAGRIVDSFIAAHERLQELGVLEKAPAIEPPSRAKGYFRNWLDSPMSVKLSDDLWRMQARGRLPDSARRADAALLDTLPASAGDIQERPKQIRLFRDQYSIRQETLADNIGVSRQTLSMYERSLRPVPADKANRILEIWKRVAKKA